MRGHRVPGVAVAATALAVAGGAAASGVASGGAAVKAPASAEAAAGKGTADRVLFNGRIYTVDPARPWASAVAIHGRRIAYVGNDSGAKRLAELALAHRLPGLPSD